MDAGSRSEKEEDQEDGVVVFPGAHFLSVADITQVALQSSLSGPTAAGNSLAASAEDLGCVSIRVCILDRRIMHLLLLYNSIELLVVSCAFYLLLTKYCDYCGKKYCKYV